MPSSVRRQAAHLALILAVLPASAPAQTAQTVHVEFNLFSGRPRPRAEIADSLEARAILDSLAVRIASPVPCSEIPPMGSTPLYTGTFLEFSVPIAQRRAFIVREGYVYYDVNLPCYRDPGSNLEKLAVATAFQYPDLNAPGGPRPMEYLSCMVPDSLHAESRPCATGLRPPTRRDSRPSHPRAWSSLRFGLDGRHRPPDSPIRLFGLGAIPAR